VGRDPNVYEPPPEERRPEPRLALSIGQMAARRWAVRAVCDRCGVILWCDLRVLAATVGPDSFFWGRRGRCRAMSGLSRCVGQVRFEARPVLSEAWWSLDEGLMTARHLWKIRRTRGRPLNPARPHAVTPP
jgi:hypothetical protein